MNAVTLRRAADLTEQIEALTAERDQLLGGQVTLEAGTPTASRAVSSLKSSGSRRFTPEAIEKIRAAQRRRWKNTRKAAAAAAAATAAAPVATPAPEAAAPAVAPAPAVAAAPAPAAPAPAAPAPAAKPAAAAPKSNVKAAGPQLVAA